jgi:hypothetical protein
LNIFQGVDFDTDFTDLHGFLNCYGGFLTTKAQRKCPKFAIMHMTEASWSAAASAQVHASKNPGLPVMCIIPSKSNLIL